MARNECLIDAPPERVFEVLSDPRCYAYWVIGSMNIREADANWPQAGSRFHHTVGVGPLRIEDHTVVEEVEPGRFLQLETKVRPFGNARVKLELEPRGAKTRVTMVEDPADRATAFLFMPLVHLLMRARNVSSLDRLAELAEGRCPMPGEEPDAETRTTSGPGSVDNPAARERRRAGSALARLRDAGSLLAGLLGRLRRRLGLGATR